MKVTNIFTYRLQIVLRWPLEVAEFMFDHGADLNKGDKYGRTPLHVAASVNSAEMIHWLVENGGESILVISRIYEPSYPKQTFAYFCFKNMTSSPNCVHGNLT